MGCKCCEGNEKEVRVLFCPECKSRDVGYVFGLNNLFGVIPKMKCRDCSFFAPGFPVLVMNEKLLKDGIKKMKVKNAKKSKKKNAGGKKK